MTDESVRLKAKVSTLGRTNEGTADGNLGTAKIASFNSNHDVKTLAVALVYACTGVASYCQKAKDAIMSAIPPVSPNTRGERSKAPWSRRRSSPVKGYEVWNWQKQALLRAVQFLDDLDRQYGGWWAAGDDRWQPWLVNFVYGTSFPTSPTSPTSPGKTMGWTDWMYGF